MNAPKIKVKKRAKPQNRHKNNTFNKMFVISVIIILSAVIVAFTPYFQIKNINIEGNSHLDDEYICRVSGISRGMNTFSIKLSEVKNNLLAEPYIHSVKLKRVFPNDVKIVVTESDPAAVIPYADGKFVLVDRYGKALEEMDVENGKYPEITGVAISMTDGREIKAEKPEDEAKVKLIPDILNELLLSNVKNKVVEINISKIDDIKFILNGGKMEVRLYDMNEMAYKLKMLSAITKKLEAEGKTEGIIDFEGENPVYRPSDKNANVDVGNEG